MKKYILFLIVSVFLFNSCKKDQQDTLKINFNGSDYMVAFYKLYPSDSRPALKPVEDQNGRKVFAEFLESIHKKEQYTFSKPTSLGDSYMMVIQKGSSTTLSIDAYDNDAVIQSWTLESGMSRKTIYLTLK